MEDIVALIKKKLMKYLIPLLLYILVPYSSNAQFGSTDLDDFKDIEKKTTLILATGDRVFDKYLRQTLDSLWKITKLQYIWPKEIESYTNNPDYLFLTYPEYSYYRETPRMDYTIHNLILTNDLKKDRKGNYDIEKVTQLATAQENSNPNWQVVDVKAEVIQSVKLILDHCHFVMSGKAPKKSKIKDYLKQINQTRGKKIKSKKLLLNRAILKPSINSVAAMKAIYPFKFQLMKSDEVYENILLNQERGAYFTFYREKNIIYHLLIESETGALLYGTVAKGLNQGKIGPAIFKRLSEL